MLEEVKTESYKALAYRGKRYTAIDWLQSIRNQGHDVGLQIRKSNASGELIASQKIYYGNKNKYHQALDLLNLQDTIQLYYSDGSQERITKANFQKQANEGSTILPYWIVLDIDLDHKESIVLENPSLTNRLRALDALNLSYWFFATKEGRGIKVVLQFKNMMAGSNYDFVIKEKIHDKIGNFLSILLDCEMKKGIQQCSLLYPPEEGHEPIHAKTGKPLYLIHSTGSDNDFFKVMSMIIDEDKKKKEKLIPEEKKEDIIEPIITESSILKDKELLDRLCNYIQLKVIGEENTIKAILCITIGGLCCKNISPTSTNMIVSDESGAGKDFVIGSCLELIPQDMLIKYKRISPTALSYSHNIETDPSWSWNRKILYLEDINNKILNCEVLKLLMSNSDNIGYFCITIDHKAKEIGIKGKPIIIASTYKGTFDEETTRRVTSIFLDTSKEQTERIFKKIVNEDNTIINYDLLKDIRLAISYLKPVKVIIPFSKNLIKFIDIKRVTMRTDFRKILDMIKFSASIYQYQRESDKDGNIIANKQDYGIMCDMIKTTTLARYGLSITKSQKKLIDIFKMDELILDDENIKNDGLRFSQIRDLVPHLSEKNTYRYLNTLTSKGILRSKNVPDLHGNHICYWNVVKKPGLSLPSYEELINTKEEIEETPINKKYDKLKGGLYKYLEEFPKDNVKYLNEYYLELVTTMSGKGDLIEIPKGTYRKP